MTSIDDAVSLAQQLVRFDTRNPPGQEAQCATFLQALLTDAGFSVRAYSHSPGRTSLVARAGEAGAPHSLCFVGHLDTVPLGKAAWKLDPFAGVVADGRLHGRGACDMKSGVAAFVTAAVNRVSGLPAGVALTLLLVAGEETGCEGSSYLASLPLALDGFTGVVVAEPTFNEPLLGHKGALWLRATARGCTAHGATPEAGVNAIAKAVRMVDRLQAFGGEMSDVHPVLGVPSLNIGTFHAGENVNSVPDWAEVGIDLRTLPGMDHAQLREQLTQRLRPELESLDLQASLDSVFTEPADPWVQSVLALAERETGRPATLRTAHYFTDASALKGRMGATPILILGPGHPSQMHQTDEFCDLSQIDEAVRVYSAIIDHAMPCAEAASADTAPEPA
ncbi:Acetylornithine deacetylase (plasmid) [Variovorax sp. SRS16]|uniref:M20 family metallopeptidase n=1 Tax=Variovorax sp. SRS16 TaxID=282217 RepID=UPI001315B22F|nr:M20 family metallopeptidase [Variovorax sp. SRS16]VTU45945.1 Acetylornithine deacetylase [Variovorax sp. SRS16]